MPKVVISSAWSHEVGGQTEFEIPGDNVEQLVCALADTHPVLRRRLVDPSSRPFTYYNAYVDGEMVARGTFSSAQVRLESVVELVPPMAGG